MNQMIDAMASLGLHPGDYLIADGRIHRFHVEGDRRSKKNGWYVYHGDRGTFGSWKTGEEHNWFADSDKLDTPNKPRVVVKNDEMEFARDRRRAAQEAQKVWNEATVNDGTHPYLKLKCLNADAEKSKLIDTCRVSGDRLVIPVYYNNAICSLQYIFSDGQKRFHPGGRMKGGYVVINPPVGIVPRSKFVAVTEGWATGVTLAWLLGWKVWCAFSVSNLERIVIGTLNLNPIIAADNDHMTKGNPGLTEGHRLAEQYNLRLVYPACWGIGTDFNDLFIEQGKKEVRVQVSKQLSYVRS